MKSWLVSVALLFVVAEFLLWVRSFILPLPIYLLGGAFLAIASNYEKGIFTLFRSQELSQTATLIETAQSEFSDAHSTVVTSLPQQQQQQSEQD